MLGRRKSPPSLVLAPVAVVPSGNVRLAPRVVTPVVMPVVTPAVEELVPATVGGPVVVGANLPPAAELVPAPREEQVAGWSVHDARGTVVMAGLHTRAEALRAIGALAMRGAALPLTVFGPDGAATGDHLA